MKKNGELIDKNCLLYENLDFLSKKWMIFIIMNFCLKQNEILKYNQIKKNLPNITSRVLSLRLNELTNKKIISKKINHNTSPITTEYKITKKGNELIPIIEMLRDWGKKNYSCKYKKECFRCTFE